jgi:hypothetical protein
VQPRGVPVLLGTRWIIVPAGTFLYKYNQPEVGSVFVRPKPGKYRGCPSLFPTLAAPR